MTPLSDLHAALGKIERTFDATRLNEIVNHESVLPWVRGAAEGPLDLTDILASPSNICLMGDHGAEVFVKIQHGMYEAHTSILPDGRGAWAVRFVRAALHHLFTRTDAVEVLTRCPTLAAKALAKAIGGTKEFTNPNGWILDGKSVPADIYALRIQDWMRTAPGLEERGHWFHERLEAEYARHGMTDPVPHPDDDVHDRYVGAACEMFLGDVPNKAAIFYNRFATMAGYEPVSIIDYDPLTLDIRDAVLIVRDEDFFMPICRKAA